MMIKFFVEKFFQIDSKQTKIFLDYRFTILIALFYTFYTIKVNKKLKSKNDKKFQETIKNQNKIKTIKGNDKNIKLVNQPRNIFLTSLMFIHNLFMSLFSYLVFNSTFKILHSFYKNQSFKNFLSDPDQLLCNELQPNIFIFYISKYVEILDTIIVHLNKRPTSFLQGYHHAGAIVCCWMFAVAHSHVAWIFVLLNSFVHTVMYSYYAMISVGLFLSKLKKFKFLITYMQITQFVIGTCICFFHLIFGKVFANDPALRLFQMVAIIMNISYVAVLYILFKAFAKENYETKKNGKEE